MRLLLGYPAQLGLFQLGGIAKVAYLSVGVGNLHLLAGVIDEIGECSTRRTAYFVDGQPFVAREPDQRAVKMNIGCMEETETRHLFSLLRNRGKMERGVCWKVIHDYGYRRG